MQMIVPTIHPVVYLKTPRRENMETTKQILTYTLTAAEAAMYDSQDDEQTSRLVTDLRRIQ